MTEHWYLLTKYIGSIIAAVYGIYATLTDFRDKKPDGTKYLTTKGYLGIALTIIASVLALSSDAIKDKKDIESAKADEEHRQELTGKMADELAQTETIKTNLDSSLAQQQNSFGIITARMQNELQTMDQVRRGLDQSLARQTETLKAEQELAIKQQLLQLQVLRPYYPLEPITISYQITFSMDDPAYKTYLERVRKDIVRDWNANRRPFEIELTEPEDIKAPINLSFNKYKWLPGTSPGEDSAARPVLGTGYEFDFAAKANAAEPKIQLLCAAPEYDEAFNHLSKGPPKFNVTLSGDFGQKRFIEDVECENPFRWGDATTFSVLDLVGLVMTWKASPPSSKLERVSFRFPNDLNYEDPKRQFSPSDRTTSLTVDPAHVGMGPIYEQLSISH